jgi:proline dehydrogenase
MGLFGGPKQKDEKIEQMKALLDKLEYADLDKLCKDVIGKSPKSDNARLERIQILEVIWECYRKGNLNFQQVKDFAVKQGSIPADFLD